MIGVSPAYYISRAGERFTPQDVAEALPEISGMGFRGVQLEVFHEEVLDLWLEGGARLVQDSLSDVGLVPTQFVAHFLMRAFGDPEQLRSDYAVREMTKLLEIVYHFDACRIITVPLGPFEPIYQPEPSDYHAYQSLLTEKLGRLLEMVSRTGRTLALEILPSALIGGIDGFLRFCDQLGSADLGLNFDTGHAWACKENLYLVPAKLGKRIVGTHLCDNLGHQNLSLRPGRGSIDWPRMIGALKAVGYDGSYDLEIACERKEIRMEYEEGRTFLKGILCGSGPGVKA